MQASNAPGNPPDDSSPTAANSANSGSPLDEPCPTLEQLAALSRGTLAPIDEAALIAHLDRCPRCCGRLEAIDGPTPPPAALGRWSSIEMAPPALAALLSRWKRESPDTMDVDRRAAPPGATAAAKGASSAERSRMEADYVVHMLRSSGPPTDPKYLCRLGRYDVIEIVGQGGMAIVFKARDASLQRITAIKVLRPHLAADPLARKRFVREGQAVAAVRDPHVIGVYAVEEDVALPYLVMEFVAGTSLQERLDRHGPPTLAETLRIGRQIAAGLAAAHAQGLIHRDVKPANVLLENGGQRVKISDFGLARQTDATALTESGVVAGTPAYMSPEQVQGAALDPRSDLFSLGSVLYTMCTGRPPFNAATLLSTMRQVAEDAPPPIRNLNADSPPWLADVIRKLHEKSPGDRFQSAEEVDAVLSQGLAFLQQPSGAPEPERIYEADADDGKADGDGRSETVEVRPGASKPTADAAMTRDGAKREADACEPASVRRVSGLAVLLALAACALSLIVLAEALGYPSVSRLLTDVFRDPPLAQRTPAPPAENQPYVAPPPAPLEFARPVDRTELLPSEAAPFTGHTGPVVGLAFSPDGKTLASCSGMERGDRSVRLWDAKHPEQENQSPRTVEMLKRPYTPPTNLTHDGRNNAARQVYVVKWLPHGRSVLAAGALDEVLEIDATPGEGPPKIVRWVKIAQGPIYDLAVTGDGKEFYAAGQDGVIRRFNLESGERLSEWWTKAAPRPNESPANRPTGPAAVRDLSLSPDGARLATASSDSVVRIWDCASGRILWESERAVHPSMHVEFADAQRLLVASDALRLYDVNTGRSLWTSESMHTGGVAVDAKHNLIATCGIGRATQLRDLETGEIVASLGLGDRADYRQHAAFSPDGETLVTSMGLDYNTRVGDYRIFRYQLQRRGGQGIPDRAFESGRRPDATAPTVALVRPAGEVAPPAAPSSLALAPFPLNAPQPASGPHATAGSPLSGHGSCVTGTAFSRDGLLLATCSARSPFDIRIPGDGSVRLWAATTSGRVVPRTLDLADRRFTTNMYSPATSYRELAPGQAHALAFLPDNRTLLAVGAMDDLLVIDASPQLNPPRVVRTIRLAPTFVSDPELAPYDGTRATAMHALAVAPDGESFYVSGEGGVIRRFNTATGELIHKWSAPPPWSENADAAETIVSLDLNPAGDRLLSAGLDRIVRMWNAETGELIWAAKPFPLPLNSARFVDRDRVLVCTDTLQLWNAQTGEPIWTAPRSHPTIAAVNVARDLIVTGSALSTVRFWDLKTGRETANLPASLGRLCVALSPDGNWLVAGGHTGSTDERLLRWRIEYPAAAEAESQTNDESETAGAAPGQTAEPQRELLNVAPLRPGLLRSELLKE